MAINAGGNNDLRLFLTADDIQINIRLILYATDQLHAVFGLAHSRCSAGFECNGIISTYQRLKTVHRGYKTITGIITDSTGGKGVVPQAQRHTDHGLLDKGGPMTIFQNAAEKQTHGITTDINSSEAQTFFHQSFLF